MAGRHRRLEGVALIAGMVVTAVNVALAAPLAGLLAASRVSGDRTITMLAVATFCVVAGAVAFGLVRLLAVLGAAHDRLVGRDTRTVRRHVSWMRSMSGERPHVPEGSSSGALSALDAVLVVVVVAALLAFEVWFAFFSGSPLDGRSGR